MVKKITLDDLARMVKQSLDETATKHDLTDFAKEIKRVFASKDDIRESEKRILRAVEGVEFKIASSASTWNKDFERLHGWIMEIDERLTMMEAKAKSR